MSSYTKFVNNNWFKNPVIEKQELKIKNNAEANHSNGRIAKNSLKYSSYTFEIEEIQTLLLIGCLKKLKVFVFLSSVTVELIVSSINSTHSNSQC